MVSTRSKSSSPFNKPLVTAPKAPITIGISVTFMFHFFFQFPCKVEVLILLFTFSQFYSMINQESKIDNFANFSFFFLLLLLGPVFWSRFGDPFVCESPTGVYHYYYSQVFHTTFNCWFSSENWVTASLLRSSELF